MQISSDFVILDVKNGRHELAKRIEAGEKLSVLAHIKIDAVHSRDDGISIEFSGCVLNIVQSAEAAGWMTLLTIGLFIANVAALASIFIG